MVIISILDLNFANLFLNLISFAESKSLYLCLVYEVRVFHKMWRALASFRKQVVFKLGSVRRTLVRPSNDLNNDKEFPYQFYFTSFGGL